MGNRGVCVLRGGVCLGGGYSRGEYPGVATEGVEYPGGGYSGMSMFRGWVPRDGYSVGLSTRGRYSGGEYLGWVGTQG